jgi:hypothetical protein
MLILLSIWPCTGQEEVDNYNYQQGYQQLVASCVYLNCFFQASPLLEPEKEFFPATPGTHPDFEIVRRQVLICPPLSQKGTPEVSLPHIIYYKINHLAQSAKK